MTGMDLATMAGRFPDREAVVVDGRSVTYAELDRAANRLAHHLLLEHPGVADAAVVGVPDDDLGERVVAAVEPKVSSPPVAAEDLIAFCRDRIAAFKCPKAVVFVDALHRSEAGKLDKRALRARVSSDDVRAP